MLLARFLRFSKRRWSRILITSLVVFVAPHQLVFSTPQTSTGCTSAMNMHVHALWALDVQSLSPVMFMCVCESLTGLETDSLSTVFEFPRSLLARWCLAGRETEFLTVVSEFSALSLDVAQRCRPSLFQSSRARLNGQVQEKETKMVSFRSFLSSLPKVESHSALTRSLGTPLTPEAAAAIDCFTVVGVYYWLVFAAVLLQKVMFAS